MRPTPLHLQMCPNMLFSRVASQSQMLPNMLSLNCENVKTTPPKRDRNVPKYVVAAGVSRPGAEAHRNQLSVVIKLRSDSPHMKKELT